MAGTGGQASSIAQKLCEDWVDDQGKTHPGIFDDEAEIMKRWAEAYPHAKSGVLHMLEPSKWRTLMFEAIRTLAPMGDLIFPPDVPKSGILEVYNETNKEIIPRKLNRKEEESLLQMHLMVEEMCLVVRTKNKTTGRITYGLPPEHARKVHDDRAYTLAMACLIIKQAQEKGVLGDPKPLDYNSLISSKTLTNNNVSKNTSENEQTNPWLKNISSQRGGKKSVSPFSGPSPFRK